MRSRFLPLMSAAVVLCTPLGATPQSPSLVAQLPSSSSKRSVSPRELTPVTDPVGMVVLLKGEGTVTHLNQVAEPLSLRAPIYVGDRIETDFGAVCQINFLDRTKVSLAGSSDYTVDFYSYNDKEAPQSEGTLNNGALKFMAGKIGKVAPENFKVKTAMATVGIRGSSGEIQASDGSLPGVEPSFQVMMTAGVGLTASFEGQGIAPPLEMNTPGAGIVADGQGVGQPVRFSSSLMGHYQKSGERKVQQGRKKARQNALSSPAASPEEEQSAVASGEKGTAGAGGEALASQSSLGGSTTDSGEQGSLGAEEQQQAAVGTPPSQGEQGGSLVAGGTEPASATGGSASGELSLATVGSEGGEELPGEGAFTQTPFTAVTAAPPPVEGPAFSLPSLVAQGELGEAADAVTFRTEGLAEAAFEEEVTEAEQGAGSSTFAVMEGKFLGLYRDGGSTFSSLEGLTVTRDPSLTDPEEQLSLDFQGQSRVVATTLPDGSSLGSGEVGADAALVDGIFTARLVGEEESFYVAALEKETGTDALLGVSYFGTPTASLPATGLKLYGGEATSMGGAAGAAQIEGEELVHPGLMSYMAVDFDASKLVGHLRPLEGSSAHGGHEEAHHEERSSYGLFSATLLADGTLGSGKLYRNLGFEPSHVQLSGDFATALPSFDLQDQLTQDFILEGKFYGSEGTGVGVHGEDGASGKFLAAAFAEEGGDSHGGSSTTYVGRGYGTKVTGAGHGTVQTAELTGVSLTPSFGSNALTGTLTLDGGDALAVDSDVFAADREVLFGALEGTGGFSTEAGTSFLAALPLPVHHCQLAHVEFVPEEIMWGTWNVVGSSGSNEFYPGQHSFWVAGVPTPVGATGTVEEKLDADASHTFFKGEVARTFVDRNGTYFDGNSIEVDPMWKVDSVAMGMADSSSSPLDGLALSTPFVGSDRGQVTLGVNYSDNSVRGIVAFHDGSMMVMKGDSGSVTTGGFSGKITFMNLRTDNNTDAGLWRYVFPNTTGVMEGFFAGDHARAIGFDFDRELDYSSYDCSLYGVGAAVQASSHATPSTLRIEAPMHGVIHPRSAGSPVLLDTPDLKLVLNGDPANHDLTFDILVNGGTESFEENDLPINTFLDKDAFLGMFDTDTALLSGPDRVTLASNHVAYEFDPESSFVATMPGLEGFSHISWGMWIGSEYRASESDPYYRAEGFFGGGISQIDGVNEQVPDYTTIASWTQPTIRYSGPSKACYHDSATGMRHICGETVLDVNFSSGAVAGSVDFGMDGVVNLSGSFSGATHSLSGTADLNGVGTGSFSGGFYHDQTAGTFGASDGTDQIVGAFGGQAEQTLPLVNRS